MKPQNMTKDEYLKARDKYEKNVVSKLPMIYMEHLQEIKDFIATHEVINTKEEADAVLAFFESLKDEWKEYTHLQDTAVFPCIYEVIANAYRILEMPQQAISTLKECLDIITNESYYKWSFKIKADIYTNLAVLYYNLGDIDNARNNIRLAICQYLTRFNFISYNDFSFYAFRPIRDYITNGIRDNQMSLANPTSFNDPVDPALLSHLQLLIEAESKKEEKDLLQLQKDVYGEIRIACLSRAIPLPTEEYDPASYVKDPPFKEINKSTMWGYYANSHKGICIKYVFPSSFTDHDHQKNGEVLILRNVLYKDQYDPHSDTFNYDDGFFAKGKAWAHEGECRLVYFKEEGNVSDYPYIDLPDNCIKEIYIGCKASAEDKSLLKQALINKPGIKLFQMKVSPNNLFELEPKAISLNDL